MSRFVAPPTQAPERAATHREHLDEILAARAVRAVFQPLVEIDTGAVVGYEALARGPEGSPLERPDLLFAAARAAGRLAELDWACRGAAFAAALDAGMEEPLTLFVNVEPEVLDAPHPAWLDDVVARAQERLSVVVECTERALTARPAELLQVVARLRELGWGVAVDDVGADRNSLAIVPFLRPDVIKLDLRLVQQHPTAEIAEIVSAVNAEAERAGAVLLAEGIETPRHAATAKAMGATLGQGWLYGRPGPLPAELARPRAGLRRDRRLATSGASPSPFEVASLVRPTRDADKRLLIAVSKHLESQARALGGAAVVLAAFQDARFFTSLTAGRYADLAEQAAFVGVLGVGMAPEPVPGVRGAVLAPDDPVRGEWDVAVVGPHFAGALVARDLGDDGPDADRRFEFVLTYDRDLAVEVASSLMRRIGPMPLGRRGG